MKSELYWQREGSGDDLVLVHGWGMNGAVWQQTVDALSHHFTVHVVDLPGYGHSSDVGAEDLDEIVRLVLQAAPEKAIWVGWSLGGLIATQVALQHAERVSKLITVASSPKFAAERPWRGIKPEVLDAFTEQLMVDFKTTIERFMALQAMGSPTARQDVKTLKRAVLSRTLPSENSLKLGLALLAEIDLRGDLAKLTMPLLRLYGRLDGLVPVKVADDLLKTIPYSTHYVFSDSSHAPFMTELDLFCDKLIQFSGK
ncbi:pimeloyl-ACP methyl ester esterase BioH [Vibrio sp. 99-8-1]|uniref:pimeloyl-ACP methyl ester esterase BioH n=1 Tax=Vibrio sp. 99-8-1 TaxID=2607602 RepID=UPI0014936077|nr:pimeloyl-ACP methyl ester esterase BioH [Vibrio sp. 99-8-1]NOI66996.1 pimeloyl-ACP methyl ester esterase BioH [Vibrio sp. 99-8-1]